MPEMHVPAAEVFAAWHVSMVPEAVVRLRCHCGSDLAELWLTPDGEERSWGGLVKKGERGPVWQQGVGYFQPAGEGGEWVRSPVNPDRPEAQYSRDWFECRDAKCREATRVTEEGGGRALSDLLVALRDGGLPAAVAVVSDREFENSSGRALAHLLDHPSGATAVALELNAFLRMTSKRRGRA